MVGWESFIVYLSAAIPAFAFGLIVGRNRKTKEGTPSASHNSAMLEIALCVQRVFTIVNQGAMGKFCDLESDINAVVAQLQQ